MTPVGGTDGKPTHPWSPCGLSGGLREVQAVSAGSDRPIPWAPRVLCANAFARLSYYWSGRPTSSGAVSARLLPLPDPPGAGLYNAIRANQPKSGKKTDGLAKVPPDSWLAVTTGGVHSAGFRRSCDRLLFFNADRLSAGWVGCCFTISLLRFTVGLSVRRKAWQYFLSGCPRCLSVYFTTRGLLGSQTAHSEAVASPQSHCLTARLAGRYGSSRAPLRGPGQQPPGIDIDCRSGLDWPHWLNPNSRLLIVMLRLGLVIGYFPINYLYAGQLGLLFCQGPGSARSDQLATLLQSGPFFSVMGQPNQLPRPRGGALRAGLCNLAGDPDRVTGRNVRPEKTTNRDKPVWSDSSLQSDSALESDQSLAGARIACFCLCTFGIFQMSFLSFPRQPLICCCPCLWQALLDLLQVLLQHAGVIPA